MAASGKPLARGLVETAAIVVVAVAAALLIQAFLIKPYQIPSTSMVPTLKVGQRILVDRLAFDFGSPKIGDVVVFHPPANYAAGCGDAQQGQPMPGDAAKAQACDVVQTPRSSTTFVKRIVGLPGDHLQIVNGRVIRNGKAEPAAYALTCNDQAACDFPKTIVVPKGDYYMMGDNRPISDDSRFWGPVPRSWIIGKVFFTYWPIDHIGFM